MLSGTLRDDMGDLDDIAAVAKRLQAKQTSKPPLALNPRPVVNTPPPAADPISPPATPIGNWLDRWKRKSGARSVAFQTAFGVLTAIVVLSWSRVAFFIISALHTAPKNSASDEVTSAITRILEDQSFYMFIGWALVAVPSGIAAIVTYEGNKPE
jgi:hypothetical protein